MGKKGMFYYGFVIKERENNPGDVGYTNADIHDLTKMLSVD